MSNKLRRKRIAASLFCFFFLTRLALAAETKAPETITPPLNNPSAESRLTLELQGVSIFDVFKTLSKNSRLNIVAGKNVQGQVSIFLKDVPVRDALKTILQAQGLASVEETGIIKVMTEDDYFKKYGRPYEDTRQTQAFHLQHAAAEVLAGKLADIKSPYGKIITEARTNTLVITEIPKVLEEMQNLIEESDQDQETAVLKLNYSKVEDLEPKLKTFMEGAAGKMEIDKRSNRIIAVDIPDRIQRLRSLVKAFDVQSAQVLIDAKIVEVRLSDAYRKGINWQEIIEKVGSFNTLTALAPLAVSPPTGAASLATLALGEGSDDLQTVFQLLERVGKTNLLSSPRLTVINNEEAKLAVATREPFVSQTVVQTVNSTNTADNVQFIDVGVTLKVQAQISQDNDFIEMKIKPEVSSSNRSFELEGVAQGSNTAFTRTSIPVVTTQQLETTVRIQSGHTLIVGGLIQDQQSKESSRIPFFSRIPFLGRLFENKSNDFSKTELVMFLTPVIVKATNNDEDEAARFLNAQGASKPFEAFGGYATDLKYDTLIERRNPYWELPPQEEKGKKRG